MLNVWLFYVVLSGVNNSLMEYPNCDQVQPHCTTAILAVTCFHQLKKTQIFNPKRTKNPAFVRKIERFPVLI